MGTLRVAPDCMNYCVDFPAISPDPPSGTLIAEIDPGQMGGPGIYLAEMAVFSPDGECVAASNKFYLIVEPSLFGGQCGQPAGPPSMAEIRMELRDCSTTDNALLNDMYAFSDSDIITCMRAPVDYWNEALPPIPPYFTTQNFPFRYWWKQGTKAQLYRMAAEYHRRNQVSLLGRRRDVRPARPEVPAVRPGRLRAVGRVPAVGAVEEDVDQRRERLGGAAFRLRPGLVREVELVSASAIKRLRVDHMVQGITRLTWEIAGCPAGVRALAVHAADLRHGRRDLDLDRPERLAARLVHRRGRPGPPRWPQPDDPLPGPARR